MSFKKILYIGQHEEDDEEIDDKEEEKKQVKIHFPESKIPATYITPELARKLAGKAHEFRIKIESAIKGVDPDRFIIKK